MPNPAITLKTMPIRQQRFVEFYAAEPNAAKAARRAGYAVRTARTMATNLLSKPHIQEALEIELEKWRKKTRMTGEDILMEMQRVAQADLRDGFDEDGKLLAPKKWSDDFSAGVSDVSVETANRGEGDVVHTTKIKRADKLRALEMLARHHSLFNDRVQVDVEVSLVERLNQARLRSST